MNNLEELCRPLVLLMCKLREFRRHGLELEMETLLNDIQKIFASIREQCKDNIALSRDFSIIEKPLAFFIDYMVKESDFSFSQSWPEMGRTYGELSGDEKFFDILYQSMDDHTSMDRISLFYIMIGLGFRGIYKNEPDILERKMKLCATRMPQMLDVTKEPLTPQYYDIFSEPKRNEKFFLSPKFILALSIFFMFCSLMFNYYIFDSTIKPFQKIIDRASSETTLYIGVENMPKDGNVR